MVFIFLGAVKAAQLAKKEFAKEKERTRIINPIEGSAGMHANGGSTSAGVGEWWDGANAPAPPPPQSTNASSSHAALGAWSRDELLQQQQQADAPPLPQRPAPLALPAPAPAPAPTSASPMSSPRSRATVVDEESEEDHAAEAPIVTIDARDLNTGDAPPRGAEHEPALVGSFEALATSFSPPQSDKSATAALRRQHTAAMATPPGKHTDAAAVSRAKSVPPPPHRARLDGSFQAHVAAAPVETATSAAYASVTATSLAATNAAASSAAAATASALAVANTKKRLARPPQPAAGDAAARAVLAGTTTPTDAVPTAAVSSAYVAGSKRKVSRPRPQQPGRRQASTALRPDTQLPVAQIGEQSPSGQDLSSSLSAPGSMKKRGPRNVRS